MFTNGTPGTEEYIRKFYGRNVQPPRNYESGTWLNKILEEGYTPETVLEEEKPIDLELLVYINEAEEEGEFEVVEEELGEEGEDYEEITFE